MQETVTKGREMAFKRLQALSLICICTLFYSFWPSLMHNLSRVYETFFIEAQYEYVGLLDVKIKKDSSWALKILCHEEYATPEFFEFLHHIEESNLKKTLHNHRGKLTEKFLFGETPFVVKSTERKGVFANLISMGTGVTVWNNAHWAVEKGIPVLKPVALVEKRLWNKTKSFVVYLYEGKQCETEFKENEEFFPKVFELTKLLQEKKVIHHDFRLRNIVLLDDGSLQFIDIDKLHYYQKKSHVFNQRLKREVKKFNLNLVEQSNTRKRLEI